MKTYEFKSEKNWLRTYDHLDDKNAQFSSYGYMCITVFTEYADELLHAFVSQHRIAMVEA